MIRAAVERQRNLKDTSRSAVSNARRLWRDVDPGAVNTSWQRLLPQMATVIIGTQVVASQNADDYTQAALDAQGLDRPADGRVDPQGLAGVASDGRPLASLLSQPVVVTLAALAAGATQTRAMAEGYTELEMITRTQVADAFRAADSVAAVSRRVTHYVRVLTPPSCSRCVVLAGSDRAWNSAFRRHPGCDCISLPTTVTRGLDQRTDPRGYFDSLSPAEQDRVFTNAGAAAIRDGADIGQVVNARRKAAGMTETVSPRTRRRVREQGLDAGEFATSGRGGLQTVEVFGEQRFVTLEGRGVDLPGGGTAPRLMPESIYEIARDPEHAVALLKRHGYIIDRPRFRPGPDGRLTRVN